MMKTHTRGDIQILLADIHNICKNSVFGLPLYNEEKMLEIEHLIITKLGLTIMEDERILSIQKYTGCTRAQAQSLIDSGEF